MTEKKQINVEQYYTLAEVAERLHLSKALIRREFSGRDDVWHIVARRGRRVQPGSLALWIPESAVRGFIDRYRVR